MRAGTQRSASGGGRTRQGGAVLFLEAPEEPALGPEVGALGGPEAQVPQPACDAREAPPGGEPVGKEHPPRVAAPRRHEDRAGPVSPSVPPNGVEVVVAVAHAQELG